MAIYGITGVGHQVTAARAAYAVAAVSRRTSGASAPPLPGPSGGSGATSVRISNSAELLGKLRLLHDDQPKDFKRLMGELAADVRNEADKTTGERAQQLARLGERFSEAAREGNLTPLVPAIESTRVRTQYATKQDALLAPSNAARELFGGFVDKVNSVLAAGTAGQSTRRSA